MKKMARIHKTTGSLLRQWVSSTVPCALIHMMHVSKPSMMTWRTIRMTTKLKTPMKKFLENKVQLLSWRKKSSSMTSPAMNLHEV